MEVNNPLCMSSKGPAAIKGDKGDKGNAGPIGSKGSYIFILYDG